MSAHAHGDVEHPGPKTYAVIAVILTVVTLIEVWVFYIPAMQSLLVPILSVLSILKFALVVMFYMHLKFDHKAYTRMLLVGLLLAAGIMFALMALFFVAHPLMR